MAIIVGTFDTKGTRTKYLILSLLSPRFARSTNSKDSKLTPMTMRICENPRTTPAASSSRRAPSPSPHEEPPPTYPFSTAIDNEPKPSIKSRLIAGYLLVRGRAKQSQDQEQKQNQYGSTPPTSTPPLPKAAPPNPPSSSNSTTNASKPQENQAPKSSRIPTKSS